MKLDDIYESEFFDKESLFDQDEFQKTLDKLERLEQDRENIDEFYD